MPKSGKGEKSCLYRDSGWPFSFLAICGIPFPDLVYSQSGINSTKRCFGEYGEFLELAKTRTREVFSAQRSWSVTGFRSVTSRHPVPFQGSRLSPVLSRISGSPYILSLPNSTSSRSITASASRSYLRIKSNSCSYAGALKPHTSSILSSHRTSFTEQPLAVFTKA